MKNQLLEPSDHPEPFMTITPGPTLEEMLRTGRAWWWPIVPDHVVQISVEAD